MTPRITWILFVTAFTHTLMCNSLEGSTSARTEWCDDKNLDEVAMLQTQVVHQQRNLQPQVAVSYSDSTAPEGISFNSSATLANGSVEVQLPRTPAAGVGSTRGTCLDASAWHSQLVQQAPWRKYSQGNQDSILASLFHEGNLGTTNLYFVEFGFPAQKETSPPNTDLLAEQGWTGLRLDGGLPAPNTLASMNQHQEFITAENVASLFSKYAAPLEPDYVSIDIDSCDLWVLLGLTQTYRPRAISVEYNSKYGFQESKTNRCKDSAGQMYSWTGDDMFGASLTALHRAAQTVNYTMVAVEPMMDVFLVRKDLVCPGTDVQASEFQQYTGLPNPGGYRVGNPDEVQRWIVDYTM